MIIKLKLLIFEVSIIEHAIHMGTIRGTLGKERKKLDVSVENNHMINFKLF